MSPVEPEKAVDRGPWIHTASGLEMYPLDPKPEEIDIRDIARSLSMICRYGGHVLKFYSVAEHCCFVSDLCLSAGYKPIALWGLLHDASEAYLGDIVRPLKHSRAFSEVYQPMESKLMAVIAKKYLHSLPEPELVTYFDNLVLGTEVKQVKVAISKAWVQTTANGKLADPIPWRWELGWDPETAEQEFLLRFSRLSK